jgi:hypothetical protein
MTLRVALRFGDYPIEQASLGCALVQTLLHAKRWSILTFGQQARQGDLSEGASRALTRLLTKRSCLIESCGSVRGVKEPAKQDRAAAACKAVLYADQQPISQLPCALRSRHLAPKRVLDLFDLLTRTQP